MELDVFDNYMANLTINLCLTHEGFNLKIDSFTFLTNIDNMLEILMKMTFNLPRISHTILWTTFFLCDWSIF